jgi:hypothetical protein
VAAREDAALIRAHVEDMANKGIEIGRALNRQKERMPHGTFMSWVQSECGLSKYTSGAMMKAANEAEANSWLTKNSHLISVEAINRLFAKPTPPQKYATAWSPCLWMARRSPSPTSVR